MSPSSRYKIKLKTSLFCFIIALNIPTSYAQNSVDKFLDQVVPKVIYGQDNRFESQDYPDREFREYSASVAGMVQHFRLGRDSDGNYHFPQITLSDGAGVCSDEAFSDQFILPRCSGALIGPDLILTAAHCVVDRIDCRNSRWVFDFEKGVTTFNEDQVYKCEEVLEREFMEDRFKVKDYALIRLDREVTEREPLKIRKRGLARLGTPLVVMGHPSGLPLKIADGAKIQRMNSDEIRRPISTFIKKRYYFNGDLDTFGGNSGSPVFNQETGNIEGILVQGAEDYVMDEDDHCLRPNVLESGRWQAQEMVFRTPRINNLKENIKDSFRRHKK